MEDKENFLELLNKLRKDERPEKFREYSEILESDKILDKWDFRTVYRNMTEEQKYNAVLNVFRALTKSGKGIKEILKTLEVAE